MISKKEIKILKKYAKIMKIPYRLNRKLYEHGDSVQRQIDIIAQEATIWLKAKQQEGKIKPSKDGKFSSQLTNELIQQFIKEVYGDVKKMPKFFQSEVPLLMKQVSSPELKDVPKADLVIEEKAPDYIK